MLSHKLQTIQNKEKKKIYISLSEAANLCNYSQEYLSLRARQGKLKAVKRGRNWFTTKEWLDEYIELIGAKKEEKRDISELRNIKEEKTIAPEIKQLRHIQEKKEIIKERKSVFLNEFFIGSQSLTMQFSSIIAAMIANSGKILVVKGNQILDRLREFKREIKYEFSDFARLVVIFILICSAIFFIVQPTIEITKKEGQNFTEKTFMTTETYFRHLIARASVGIDNIINTYKLGLKIVSDSYINAPKNIRTAAMLQKSSYQSKWAKVEKENKEIKILLGNNIKKLIANGNYGWQSLRNLTFVDILNKTENLMSLFGEKEFTLLYKTELEFLKAAEKYREAIKVLRVAGGSMRIAYNSKKVKIKTNLLFVKSHPKVVFEKTFSLAEHLENKILTRELSLTWELSSQKVIDHFVGNYRAGLHIVLKAYKSAPENIAIAWQRIEERNDSVKMGLRKGIVRGNLLVTGIIKTLSNDIWIKGGDWSRDLVKDIEKNVKQVSFYLAFEAQNLYYQNTEALQKSVARSIFRINFSLRCITTIATSNTYRISLGTATFLSQAREIFKKGWQEISLAYKWFGKSIAEKLVRYYEITISKVKREKKRVEVVEVRTAKENHKTTLSQSNEGVVVVPSSDRDEEVKKKIRESFSDEVKIEIQDETSGIVTPVFKDREGDRYLYMMVPFQEQN